MADRLTSPKEAARLKTAIDACADELEREGFGRGQIGAAMAGIGLAMSQIYNGHHEALAIVNATRDLLLADAAGERH
jgi:hypothetical protein